AVPGLKHMRDALLHFEDWSRGEGQRGPQRDLRRAGTPPREIASAYWGFGYDPSAGTVTLGPYQLDITVAEDAATALSRAIYHAARAVDARAAAQLLASVVAVVTAADLPCNAPDAPLRISTGLDRAIWLSIDMPDSAPDERRQLAQRVVKVL